MEGTRPKKYMIGSPATNRPMPKRFKPVKLTGFEAVN